MSVADFNITVPDYVQFTKEEINSIPKMSPGVYQILSSDGEIVYVGKSKNLGNRLNQHFNGKTHTKDNYEVFESVRCFFTKNLMFMDILEVYFINTIQPRYNKASVYSDEEVDRGRVSSKENNEMWRISPGSVMAYTEDLDVIYKLKRYYLNKDKGFKIVATYHDGKSTSPYAIQFSFPSEKKRSVQRLLGVKISA
jgi:hypothetical protein